MNIRIFLFITIIFIFSAPTFSANCSISLAEEENILSLSYDEFDQTPNNGWRRYAELGCYHEMGVLIDKYLGQKKAALTDWQVIGLTWHGGQMYAFANEYEIAKKRFEESINTNESADSPIRWNDYVYATIAFLNHDMPNLLLHRDNIAKGPIFNGEKMNLDIVNKLIRHFGQPYSVAYQAKN